MTIYIVDLEPVETRYTAQWKEYLPIQLRAALPGEKVVVISGGDVPQATTPGAFLNFGGTNVYKSNQQQQIATLFAEGKVQEGDYFLYTDAWNPTVIQTRYMSKLLQIPVLIGGMWHAGSYDPQDFLGRLIGDEPWVRSAEHSMFSCYDHNFYATDFHIEMFANEIIDWRDGEGWDAESPKDISPSIRQVGWPMEYLDTVLHKYKGLEKKEIILFPHRIAPEKQPEIFRDLAKELPRYDFVFAQELNLSKHEYHTLLGEAMVVFSANLQETLGISWYEGLIVDTIPMVPDRVSYSEMGIEPFLYPSEWTSSFEAYERNKTAVISTLMTFMQSYDAFANKMVDQRVKLRDFFDGEALYNAIGSARYNED